MSAKGFKTKRKRYVETVEQMNKIIDLATSNKLTYIIEDDKDYDFLAGYAPLRDASYMYDCDRYAKFTTMFVKEVEQKDGSFDYQLVKNGKNGGKYACTWIFDKSGDYNIVINPLEVQLAANKCYNPYEEIQRKDTIFLFVDNKVIESARPLVSYNKKFDNTEHYVYCYDLNSAYANVLKDKIIDTYNWREYDVVGDDEIGFNFDNNLSLVHKGEGVADRVYKLIDSPSKEYVKKYYDMKKNAPSGSREKKVAKAYLNYCVGLWQNHNPFLRAYVVNTCNEYIYKYIKKYKDIVCMWNTDAIYTTEPIAELEIGTEIGQWRLEYEGMFRQKQTSYQKVDKEEVTYRGVPKCLFKKGFNLLTDKLPAHNFKYFFNSESCRFEENPLYEEGEEEYYA